MAVATPPGTSAPTQMAVPFRKATLKKRALMGTQAPAAALGGQVQWELDSKGYLGGVRLLASGTDTVGTANNTAQNADYPWSFYNRIQMRDSSGGMVHNLKGYSAYLLGRYTQGFIGRDPAAITDARGYVATLTGATSALPQVFSLDLPVEAGSRDNVGLLPNQNAAFRYALTAAIETTANLLTAGASGTNVWAMNIQPSYRYYTVPSPQRADGVPQQTLPPFTGVVRQLFDETQIVPSAAENRYNIVPGRVIRALILVARDSSGNRIANASGHITRVKLNYGDDSNLFDSTIQDLALEHYRMYGEVSMPAGVVVIPFLWDNDSTVGADFRRDWLDTRRLAQLYLLITTVSGVSTIDIIHDEVVVPATMAL